MKINEDLGLRHIANSKDEESIRKAADYTATMDDGFVQGWGLKELFEAGIRLGAKAKGRDVQRIELYGVDGVIARSLYFIGDVWEVQARLDAI